MEKQITREDLYFPKLGEDKEIWTFSSDFMGAVAFWAIKQSPYAIPDNLSIVLAKLHVAMEGDFEQKLSMKKFGNFREVKDYISKLLREIPEYLEWNMRKNGNDAPFHFVSRFDGPTDPDSDFIDLGALEHNVAMHIVQQSVMN